MRKAKLFKDAKERYYILSGVYDDYVNKGLTVPEISDKYGYSVRQIRYIIDRYLLVKKGKGKKKMQKGMVKLDNGLILHDGKISKKTSLDDLICKADIYRERIKDKRSNSTNKKVENK